MEKTIVSDTSPLINLEKLNDGFLFIRKLYGKILIPQAVFKELSYQRNEYLKTHAIKDIIKILPIQKNEIPYFKRKMHSGEIEAISLALKYKLPLLIEEHNGRKEAQELKIKISGIAGQIYYAYTQNIIGEKESHSKLDQLVQSGGIGEKVHSIILAKIQEN
jgi:predicted nucleic acid-binding protein